MVHRLYAECCRQYDPSGMTQPRSGPSRDLEPHQQGSCRGPGEERAERLYSRVFSEYGDDSVSQLGGAHIACEGISNVLTKILERGRLMAYLEQSTRYVPYTDRPNGQWKYVIPSEITDKADYTTFKTTLDRAFEIYAKWIESAQQYFRDRHPQSVDDPDNVYKAVIRAKALDTLRGLLPAATRSNVGVYGSGQAYEALLLKMRGHPLSEVREVASLMLPELRKVIPAFLQRVDRENRGVLLGSVEDADEDARGLEVFRNSDSGYRQVAHVRVLEPTLDHLAQVFLDEPADAFRAWASWSRARALA